MTVCPIAKNGGFSAALQALEHPIVSCLASAWESRACDPLLGGGVGAGGRGAGGSGAGGVAAVALCRRQTAAVGLCNVFAPVHCLCARSSSDSVLFHCRPTTS